MSVWFGVEIVNGRINTGIWSMWALTSKGLGWLVLLGYFFVGGWLTFSKAEVDKRSFFKVLILFGLFSCFVSLFQMIAYKGGYTWYWGSIGNYDRVRGFSENTNAYAILLAALFILLTALADGERVLSKCVAVVSAGTFLAIITLSGSRSGMLGVAFGLIGLSIMRVIPWRFLTLSALVSVSVLLVCFGSIEAINRIDKENDRGGARGAYIFQSPVHHRSSDTHRISTIRDALDQWAERPFVGIGLGAHLVSQTKRDATAPSTIHNTAIWILTEMGMVGLVLLGGFFIRVSFGVFNLRKIFPENPYHPACFGMMMAFIGASIGTEVLYQRYFWFIAGMLLVAPHSAKQKTKDLDST